MDHRVIINAFFIFYLLFVFRFVFIPFSMWPNEADRVYFITEIMQGKLPTWWEIANINFVPLRSLMRTLSAPLVIWRFTFVFVSGNFILLFPLSIFVGLLSRKGLTFKKALLIGFLTTLFIESTQLLINLTTRWSNRLVCVDDLLLNTLGALLGYFVFKKYHRFFEKIISLFYQFLTWS
ncbi:MAG: VanZ family protein [Defluviitaleaceae bacterium]|nr:VanZ family protein [Defluviitaleaceae bacterium]